MRYLVTLTLAVVSYVLSSLVALTCLTGSRPLVGALAALVAIICLGAVLLLEHRRLRGGR